MVAFICLFRCLHIIPDGMLAALEPVRDRPLVVQWLSVTTDSRTNRSEWVSSTPAQFPAFSWLHQE